MARNTRLGRYITRHQAITSSTFYESPRQGGWIGVLVLGVIWAASYLILDVSP